MLKVLLWLTPKANLKVEVAMKKKNVLEGREAKENHTKSTWSIIVQIIRLHILTKAVSKNC